MLVSGAPWRLACRRSQTLWRGRWSGWPGRSAAEREVVSLMDPPWDSDGCGGRAAICGCREVQSFGRQQLPAGADKDDGGEHHDITWSGTWQGSRTWVPCRSYPSTARHSQFGRQFLPNVTPTRPDQRPQREPPVSHTTCSKQYPKREKYPQVKQASSHECLATPLRPPLPAAGSTSLRARLANTGLHGDAGHRDAYASGAR